VLHSCTWWCAGGAQACARAGLRVVRTHMHGSGEKRPPGGPEVGEGCPCDIVTLPCASGGRVSGRHGYKVFSPTARARCPFTLSQVACRCAQLQLYSRCAWNEPAHCHRAHTNTHTLCRQLAVCGTRFGLSLVPFLHEGSDRRQNPLRRL
jgi:hypothetical protein